MGRFAQKRAKHRKQYLIELARQNPERFMREWARRVLSWCDEIRACAGDLRKRRAFALVEQAKVLLDGCDVPEQFRKETVATLVDAACRAVAGAFDPRLYRLAGRIKRDGRS